MPTETLKLRGDLTFSPPAGVEAVTVVKDPACGRFFRFRATESFILHQLDGATPFDTVRQRVEERFGSGLPAEILQQFLERIRTLGLLEGAGGAAVAKPGLVRGDVFNLRFKLFDPDRLLDALVRRLRFFFTPQFVTTSALLVLCAFGLTLGNWAEISQEFQGLLRFESLLLAWVIMLVVIAFHEFAHGLTCKHFGGQVHEMGFLLIYFQPAFFCNVSDAWLFPEKSRRLWVTFAGAYFELFLWALATLVWRVTEPQTWVHHFALIVVATSAFKSLLNMNPLIKLDGYYLLSDFLDVPNLRKKASEYLRARMRAVFGQPAAWLQEVTPRDRRVLLLYGVLAGAFSTWLLGVVALNFGGYLVREYQGWGFLLFAMALGCTFRYSIRNSFAALKSSFQRERTTGTRWGRPLKAGLLLALIAGLLYSVRPALKVSGAFVILPMRNAEVRAEIAGIIQEILVEQGAIVKPGDLIARLSDRDHQSELRKTRAEIQEKEARLKLLQAGPRAEEVDLARTAIAKATERLKFSRNQLGMDRTLFDEKLLSRRDYELTMEQVAVREKELEEAGQRLKVLQAGSRPEEIEAIEAEISRLNAHRRHLEDELRLLNVTSPVAGVITTHKLKETIGQHVAKGDLIARVHELQTVTAEIAVSENEISDVQVGQPVALKCRAYPRLSFHGKVTAIAPIASKQEEWRVERTVLVTTELDNHGLLLKPEMSGNAKIYCGEHRLGDLLTRRVTRYVRVEFWSWW